MASPDRARFAAALLLVAALVPAHAWAQQGDAARPAAVVPATTSVPAPAAAPAAAASTPARPPAQYQPPQRTKRARAARQRAAERWTGPVATYPGFRMLAGGGSRVVIDVSGKIEVAERRAEGLVSYDLRGARAIATTNRLPLITTYFRSPVARVQLVDTDDGLDLRIDLREAVVPTMRVVETETGVQIQIDFPKPGESAEVARASADAAVDQ